MATGQVTLNDAPTNSKLFRFCEKKIDRWLETLPGAKGKGAAFRVSFSDDEGEQVSCVTEVELNGYKWRSCDLAHDSQQAFMQCLKRLKLAPYAVDGFGLT